jgi:hypothetical protein
LISPSVKLFFIFLIIFASFEKNKILESYLNKNNYSYLIKMGCQHMAAKKKAVKKKTAKKTVKKAAKKKKKF